MKEYKITYNYSHSAIYEDINHWLIGCKIIEAESFIEAQKEFEEKYPSYEIRDIELLN